MQEVAKTLGALKDISLSVVLAVGGSVFLFLWIADRIEKGTIIVDPQRRKWALAIGVILLIVAIGLYVTTNLLAPTIPPSIVTPTNTSVVDTSTPSGTASPTITATPTETPKPLRNTPISTPKPPPPNCNPDMIITSPRPGEIVNGRVPIVGTARHPGFAFYKVEYGVGESPSSFIAVSEIVEREVDDYVLDTWRTDRDVIRNGTYILKLTVVQNDGNEAQPTCSIKVIVQK